MQPLLQRESRFTYSESVYVALGIQHAKRLRHIDICGLFGTTVFWTLSHKRRDFRGKKGAEHKMCVLIFSRSFFRNISRSKKDAAKYDQECVLVFM
jgi:hypothetical protein